MKNTNRSTVKNKLGTIVLFLIAVFFSVLLLEISARLIVGVPLKEKLPLSRVKPDRDIGWVMVPSDEHFSYENHVKLNQLGLRDSRITTKNAQEYRILALGDSHIYGQGIDENGLLTSVLEEELNKTTNSCQFNVINMGVRAYSTNNQLAMLKKMGLKLSPDHVILFFYINDFVPVDIENRYKRFADMDWYTFDFSDKPTKQMIVKWKLIQVFRSSAFLMWVHDSYNSWSNSSNYINKILLGKADEDIRNKFENTTKYLDDIRLLSERHGFQLTLAIIPVAAQVTKTFPDQIYQTTLDQYARSSGLDTIDLLPDLRAYYSEYQESLIIPFDGHYNAQGHRIMSNSVLEHLNTLNLCRE